MKAWRSTERLIGCWLALLACGCSGDLHTSGRAAEPPAPGQFSGSGRIEGAAEPAEIAAGLDGVLASVEVKEGDAVAAGQVIARLDCADLAAAVQSAVADRQAAEYRLERLQNGARREERDAAKARESLAEAAEARAADTFRRVSALAKDRVVSADELNRAETDLLAARAALRAAAADVRLLEAGALAEELAQARAERESRERRAEELSRRQDKCTIRAPFAGTILKRLLLPGESVSTVMPRPIVTLADLSRFTVRAELDERDVGRVRGGMRATISSAAWGARTVPGTVSAAARAMGRRRIISGDPAEKSDRDVQEVVVDLTEPGPYVVGLRVTVVFHER
jgi:multidrug resistance efflux pump